VEALTSRRVFLKTLGVLVAGAAFIEASNHDHEGELKMKSSQSIT
jgi:hypothetical protein